MSEADKSETLPEGELKSISKEMELPNGDRLKITAELKEIRGNGKYTFYPQLHLLLEQERWRN